MDMLRDMLEDSAGETVESAKTKHTEGKISIGILEGYLINAIVEALETTIVRRLVCSDAEYVEGINNFLDSHKVSLFGYDLMKHINDVRQRTKVKFGNNMERTLSQSDMFLLERVKEINEQTPEMAFRLGISELDDKLGGIYPGEIFVITGAPGSMKTSLVLGGIEQSVAKRQHVMFFSLDMDGKQLQEYRLTRYTGMTKKQLHAKSKVDYNAAKEKAMELIKASGNCLNIFDDSGGVKWNIHSIDDMVRQQYPNVHVLVIDFLSSLKHGKQTDLECVSEAMPILKRLTRDCGIITVLLSQMSRDSRKEQSMGIFGGHALGGSSIDNPMDCEIELYRDVSSDGRGVDSLIATITKSRRCEFPLSYELETEPQSRKFTGKARTITLDKQRKQIFRHDDNTDDGQPKKRKWYEDID